MDGRLISIDARTGKADPAFGNNGTVLLRDGLYPDGSDAESVGSSSPPAVVGDIVVAQVVGTITAPNKEATPGHIRGYDVRTGEMVWRYQLTHHGLWDYDPPSAPILGDITVNGERIKTVTQLTKQGMSFVFDRVTGEPVWPIEERAVPQSEVPGEQTSSTQPLTRKLA